MTTLTIRPFEATDAEYAAIVAVSNAAWPEDPGSVESWKHRDKTRDPKYLFQRLVGEVAGKIIAYGGYGESAWSYQPGKYWLDYTIHPDHQGRGHDHAFYNHLIETLSERNPVTLVSDAREDEIDKIRLLTANGFKQVMRYARSLLEVPSFDPEPFAASMEKTRQAGLTIHPLAELQKQDAGWMEQLYELEWDILKDVPSPDPLTKEPFEQFKKGLTHPDFRPDSWFIGLDGDQWAGLSMIWISSANPVKVYTGLTGVLRPYRRKGLATAMKVRAITFVQQHLGHKFIETDNEENNPMYQLNLQLGFKPAPAWLDFKKVLREKEA